jgi:crotonobetainyl-CoA:carnitine CoA-transferase CaiB-like acyl-CoA transferase
MRQMGNLAWLADDPGAMNKTAGPEADEFRGVLAGVLAEPPRTPTGGDGKGGWLDELKVLDLTNVIAGPTIGSTLARFGARVTLVQPVRPSVDPWNAIVFGLHAQRGKESVLLDLRSEKGQEALWRMAAEADVITMNGTDQQRAALRLTEARLNEINPRLILVQLDAWGGPRRGPKSDHLGYDDLAQAATGVMTRFGGGPETAEEHAHFGTIDALTGYCACVALGAALERLRLTGKGGIARASLAAAGEMIQTQFMYDYDGRPAFDEPSGREAHGWGPFYRCYAASDRWMFFAAPTERDAALARVPELSDLAGSAADIEAALSSRFAQRPAAYWARAFVGSSAGVTPLGSLHGTRDAGLQLESDGAIDICKATFRAVRHDRHPIGRWVDLVAPNAVRPGKAEITIPGPAPKYGHHTREILAGLGYGEAEIQSMIDTSAAAESWSDKYLPE